MNIADHPEGLAAASDHRAFEVPPDDRAAAGCPLVHVRCRKIKAFDQTATVEAMARLPDGTLWYAHDAQEIPLHRTNESNP